MRPMKEILAVVSRNRLQCLQQLREKFNAEFLNLNLKSKLFTTLAFAFGTMTRKTSPKSVTNPKSYDKIS